MKEEPLEVSKPANDLEPPEKEETEERYRECLKPPPKPVHLERSLEGNDSEFFEEPNVALSRAENGPHKVVDDVLETKQLADPPTPRTSPSTFPNFNLEILPLPKFEGTRRDYFRFKKDFNLHVNYETEAEKILALKLKCLKKSSDKRRIANATSLEECWWKLDEFYGDPTPVIVEIVSTWIKLETPIEDAELVKFVDIIENDVSLLKSIGKENEVENTYLAVQLEKKLPRRMQLRYSQAFVSRCDQNLSRMQFLLVFLSQEKKACNFRLGSYSKPIHNLSHRTRRGCRGRARKRGGKPREEQQVQQNTKEKLCQENTFALNFPKETDVKPTDDQSKEYQFKTLEEKLFNFNDAKETEQAKDAEDQTEAKLGSEILFFDPQIQEFQPEGPSVVVSSQKSVSGKHYRYARAADRHIVRPATVLPIGHGRVWGRK